MEIYDFGSTQFQRLEWNGIELESIMIICRAGITIPELSRNEIPTPFRDNLSFQLEGIGLQYILLKG